jgi:hypothetical protein
MIKILDDTDKILDGIDKILKDTDNYWSYSVEHRLYQETDKNTNKVLEHTAIL